MLMTISERYETVNRAATRAARVRPSHAAKLAKAAERLKLHIAELRSKPHTFTAPEKPRRGDMRGAVVEFNVYTGMAKVRMSAAQAHQRAWVKRELATMGSAVSTAYRDLERYHDLPALETYETVVDLLAPPIDTQEYAPDTTREMQYDARKALTHSRDDRTQTDRLPRRDVVPPITGEECWSEEKGNWVHAPRKGMFETPKGAALADYLGQDSNNATKGKLSRVSQSDAWELVMHCVALAKRGDVRTLSNTIRVSREVLEHYGFFGTADGHGKFDGLLGACFRELNGSQRRDLRKVLDGRR